MRTPPLTGPELATRLSYFIWGAPPDQTLLDLAKGGELLKPAVLAARTTRLLDDPRSTDLVRGFLFQWLGMERLDFFEVNRPKYPRFDDSTRLAAKNEVYETFAHILRYNSSLSDLLKADYVVINHLLADYYGIPGVKGDAYQKVDLPTGSPRGGLLGMAAINVMGGNGDRTSPVERGAWVLRKLLNDPPPPAPANVPPDHATRRKSADHRANACKCTRKTPSARVAIAKSIRSASAWRISMPWANGAPRTAIRSWTRKASQSRKRTRPGRSKPPRSCTKAPPSKTTSSSATSSPPRDDFAKGFSMALVEYALGHPCGFRDEPLLNDMITSAKKKNLATREFIQALVASQEFKSK